MYGHFERRQAFLRKYLHICTVGGLTSTIFKSLITKSSKSNLIFGSIVSKLVAAISFDAKSESAMPASNHNNSTGPENLALERIIKNLPKMSPNISDPARHEKILSYIESVLISSSCTVQIIMEMNALESLEQACLHSDDRVVSLSVRLAGLLVKYSIDDSVFDQIINKNYSILELIISNLQSENTALLFGCTEALNSLLTRPKCTSWFVGAGLYNLVLHLFMGRNLFVYLPKLGC